MNMGLLIASFFFSHHSSRTEAMSSPNTSYSLIILILFISSIFPFVLSKTMESQSSSSPLELLFSSSSSFSSLIRYRNENLIDDRVENYDSGGGDSLPLCPVNSDRPVSCPVKCFRADPVCGEDGITYWCGCAEAFCAGTKVAKLGFCEVGNDGGSGPLSGQALLLVHIVWLIALGCSVLCGIL